METFYFGDDNELFGAYLGARTIKAANPQALILNGLGQDYYRSHFVLQKLSRNLADRGFHVLQFDYFGTGDSAGEDIDCNLDRCLQDAGTAARELSEIAGPGPLHIIGLRLGANVALRLGKLLRPRSVTAWEPVLSGRTHLQTMRFLDDRIRKDRNRFLDSRMPPAAGQTELVGFAVSEQMVDNLAALELADDLADLESQHLGLVSRGEDAPVRKLIQDRGLELSVDICRPHDRWDDLKSLELALVSSPDLRQLADDLAAIA